MEQAATASVAGHGLGIGDLVLCSKLIKNHQIVVPIKMAVQTGDAYYLVMLEGSRKKRIIEGFADFLNGYIPNIFGIDLSINWYKRQK